MPEKSYALAPGETPRLSVSWRGGFKDLTVALDGQDVAAFEGPKELKQPQRLALPDGSTLEVQLASPFLLPELLLTRDGEPLPGSSGDPAARHAAAWQMIAAIAGLNVLVGLIVEATGADFLRSIGAGWPSVLAGFVYGVLAWFVRARSLVALGLAVGLFVLDGFFVLVAAAQAGSTPVGGLIARVFFLLPMLRGFGALQALAQPPRRRPAARPVPAGRPRPARPTAGPHAGAAPSAGGGTPAATAPVKVLSGDAERQRLQMTTRLNPSPAPTVLGRGPISMKGQASVDAAAAALRFLAHKVEIGAAGLKVTTREGRAHEVPWTGLGRIVARQLPPDPPWEAGLLLDLVAFLDGRWQPLRVFTTTLVNFAALGGAPSTARLENLRRLARHVRERNPGVALDEATLAFVDGGKPPARLVSASELAEYDAVYGA